VTDKQLAILLHGYVERIRAAVEQTDDALGDGVEREEVREWKYIGEAAPFSFKRLTSTLNASSEDWEEVVSAGTALALAPLWDLLTDMEWDVEALLDDSVEDAE